MGVTLERVQYKFASIIGELCSEPFVLSQFAVWLDLKLAEYKSKGCISLDCCGSLPEPDWLKGLKQAWDETKHAESATGAGDPGDSFFSLSKDTNNVGPSGAQNTGYDQNPSAYNKTKSPIPRKSDQRLRHSINRAEMAVDDTDNDVLFVEDETASDIPSVSEISSVHGSPASMPTGGMYPVHQYRRTASIQSQPVASRDPWHGLSPYSTARRLPSRPHSSQNNSGKRNSTARNIAAAVGHLRKWLNLEPRLDRRDIMEIPTEELDQYLAEFFMTIKKASGENYTRRSFEVCRYSLERYLKQNRYPYSICKSPEFSKCQHSFHKRKQSLPDSADWSYMYTPANKQSTAQTVALPAATPSFLESLEVHVGSRGGLQASHQQQGQDLNSDIASSSAQFTSVLESDSRAVQDDLEQTMVTNNNIRENDDNIAPSDSQHHSAVLDYSENPSDSRIQEELMPHTPHNEQAIKHEIL